MLKIYQRQAKHGNHSVCCFEFDKFIHPDYNIMFSCHEVEVDIVDVEVQPWTTAWYLCSNGNIANHQDFDVGTILIENETNVD